MASKKYLPLLLFQVLMIVLFFVFADYGSEKEADFKGLEDTHVMIFIGFGFLMTFLRKYCYSALGFNWLLAALAIQWALLCQEFYNLKNNTMHITMKSVFEADVMSATVLITFGALLGITSGLQLLFIAIVEPAVGCLNLYVVSEIFKAADVGGSIAIHAFGAYFGLGASLALKEKKGGVETTQQQDLVASNLNGPSYVSDVTAMIGSIFLFIYWPSFNAGLTSSPNEYQRAVINTIISLCACTVTTFIMSALVSHNGAKFDMVHVQNSTLAGGVAVGSVCNMHIGIGGAAAVGTAAGALSVLGYRFLSPILEKHGLRDTCGVNNLHGMPGIFSGILSIIMAFLATSTTYGRELGDVFPGMEEATGRSATQQGLYQLAALATTLAIGLIAGFLTGLIIKVSSKVCKPLKGNEKYDDEVNWELP